MYFYNVYVSPNDPITQDILRAEIKPDGAALLNN